MKWSLIVERSYPYVIGVLTTAVTAGLYAAGFRQSFGYAALIGTGWMLASFAGVAKIAIIGSLDSSYVKKLRQAGVIDRLVGYMNEAALSCVAVVIYSTIMLIVTADDYDGLPALVATSIWAGCCGLAGAAHYRVFRIVYRMRWGVRSNPKE